MYWRSILSLMILLSFNACSSTGTRQWVPGEIKQSILTRETDDLPYTIQDQAASAFGVKIVDITIDRVVLSNSGHSGYLITTWQAQDAFPSWCDKSIVTFKEVYIPFDYEFLERSLHWTVYWYEGTNFIEKQLQ